MLEDRDYMRQSEYRPQLSWTVALLIINAVVFVVECLTLGYPPLFSSHNLFALSVEGLKRGFVWQLLTYQFMHAGLLHILFNSLAIYVFGRPLESALGRRNFLIVYLAGGVVGGLFQSLAAVLWPEYFGGPVVGASAGAFALVAAFAVLFPERELLLLLFFVIPVRLSAKMLLLLSAVLALAGIVFPVEHIANAAHLGGMLTGVLFIRWFIQGRGLQWEAPKFSAAPRKRIGSRDEPSSFWRRKADQPEEDLSTDEFVRNQVDPILDKISRHGIQSLTARERDILEKARSRMVKR